MAERERQRTKKLLLDSRFALALATLARQRDERSGTGGRGRRAWWQIGSYVERIVAEEAAPKEMARSRSTCPEASSWPVRMLVGSRSQ